MLVAEQAVDMAEQGVVDYPTNALNDMRTHFLMFGVQAPFGLSPGSVPTGRRSEYHN